MSHRIGSGNQIPYSVVSITGLSTHNVCHGSQASNRIVGIAGHITQLIRRGKYLAVGIVGVRNGSPIRVRHGRHPAQNIILILGSEAPGIGAGSCTAHVIVYSRGFISSGAHRLRDLTQSIIGVGGHTTQGIGHSGQPVVFIVFIPGSVSVPICGRNQIAVGIVHILGALAQSILNGGRITYTIVNVGGNTAVGICDRIGPAHFVIGSGNHTTHGVGGFDQASISIILIAPSISHTVRHGDHLAFSVVGIGYTVPVGVRGQYQIANLVIRVGGGSTHGIGDRGQLILGVISIAGHISQPIALAGIETIPINRVGLNTARSIRDLHQLAGCGVLIGGSGAVRVSGYGQPALFIIGIVSDLPQGVRFCKAVACGIISVGSLSALTIYSGSQVAIAVILIGSLIAAAISNRGQPVCAVISIGDCITIAVRKSDNLIVGVVCKLLREAVRVCDFRYIANIIILIVSDIAQPVALTGAPVQVIIGNGLSALISGMLHNAAQSVVADFVQLAALTHTGVDPGLLIIGKCVGVIILDILLYHTAYFIILVLNIDFTLEILNRGKIPIFIVGVAQGISVCVGHGDQIIPIIRQGGHTTYTVSNRSQVPITVVPKSEVSCSVGHGGNPAVCMGEIDHIAVQSADILNLTLSIIEIDGAIFVTQTVTVSLPFQLIEGARV